MNIKKHAIPVIMVSALIVSSISLAFSLSWRLAQVEPRPGAIPSTAFEQLASKNGVGFGDWKVTNANPALTVYKYPAGTDPAISGAIPPVGWNGYLVDMLVTITVTFDTQGSWGSVNITYYYLEPYWSGSWESWRTATAFNMLKEIPQTTTFTGAIYRVDIAYVGGLTGYAGGHYFVVSDRRV